MASDDGKAVYRRRSNTEHAHTRMNNCGFARLPMRGLFKVKAACLLHAIVHNLIWACSRRAAIACQCSA